MFDGRHIDLSKIAHVSPPVAEFFAGKWVEFTIHFQLMDNPVKFTYEVSDWDFKSSDPKVFNIPTKKELGLEDGWEWEKKAKELAEAALNKKIEEIIAAWEDYVVGA